MEPATLGHKRREFLQLAGLGAAYCLFPVTAPKLASSRRLHEKVVLVTFGGGARDQETFAPEGQENIPHLLEELAPQSTFFTQVVNSGILGHYVASASIVTGAYETFNNFAAVAPQNPTVFEYFRRGRSRPAADAWVVAPSNGFRRIGCSSHRNFGGAFGAEVVLPKQLLQFALRSQAPGCQADCAALLQDNYESVYAGAADAGRLDGPGFGVSQPIESDARLHSTTELLRLSLDDFVAHARNLTSPDELSLYIVRQLMRQIAPSLIVVTFHDIDIAHSGAYSLYLAGIHRTDRLCAELWHAIENEPEYAGRTAMLVMPDFGRDADGDAGGNGFQHHRTGDPMSRTSWLLALGPGFRESFVVDRRLESVDVVPTIGKMLNFDTPQATGRPIDELL
jgi:hypothetical protein